MSVKFMFTTLYLPNFYLQAALRYDPAARAKAVALIQEQERKPIIIELNTAAELAGLRKGMTPSQALARCLHVMIKVRAPVQEKSIQQMLLQSAFSLSPYIEETGPGIATVEFTDTRNLISKIERVIERFWKGQIHAHAGIGNSPDTSFLAAHLAKPVLQIDDAKEFLAPLPIEALTIAH